MENQSKLGNYTPDNKAKPIKIYSIETATPTEISQTEKGVRSADKLESPTLGKIVYHNYKEIIPNEGRPYKNKIFDHLSFHETKKQGYDTYVAWNPLKSSFYIESNKKEAINNLAEEIIGLAPDTVIDSPLDKKGTVLYGTFSSLTEDQFKKILTTKGPENENNPETQEKTELEILKNKLAEIEKRIMERNQKIKDLKQDIFEKEGELRNIRKDF